MTDSEIARLANEQQRAMTDEEVLAHFGDPKPTIGEARGMVTNEIYDDLLRELSEIDPRSIDALEDGGPT
jgi:hypothetical protein